MNLQPRRHINSTSDPFFQTWRRGDHIICPSLFQMVNAVDGCSTHLSKKQARFITLLLDAQQIGGTPAYVERAITRREIFDTDPNSPINDNDIDQFVKFFRRYLGQSSITTKRGYGHILTMKRHVCKGEELEQALSLLWRSGDGDVGADR